jgi:hypothetical protein
MMLRKNPLLRHDWVDNGQGNIPISSHTSQVRTVFLMDLKLPMDGLTAAIIKKG